MINRLKVIVRRFYLYQEIRRLRKKNGSNKDTFYRHIDGLVHVGANTGQERAFYASYDLDVLWIEPIPHIFDLLQKNLEGLPKQNAVQALITDVDEKDYQFNIANNQGASSSILDLSMHKALWPNVDFVKSINLKSVTLSTLLDMDVFKGRKYQALIMDTQGSELLVLKGALPILDQFQYIKTEVADFQSYQDGCLLSDMTDFMDRYGYIELSRRRFAGDDRVGNYYDIIYSKKH